MTFSNNSFETVSLDSTLPHANVRDRLIDALTCDIHVCGPENLLVALFLIDLKDFHEINENVGFDFGDEALLTVQKRLAKQLKKASMVARVSSNTFAVIIPDLKSEPFLELAANKIRKIIAEPLQHSNHNISLECHLGVSVYPTSEMKPEKLIIQAESSLKQAKTILSKKLLIPNTDKDDTFSISDIERNLVKAIGDNELEFFYQPKVNLKTGKADSAEALIRWNSSKLGFVSPDQFIPIAEKSNLIRKVTDWGIKTAFREKAIIDTNSKNFSLSVNLSTRDLYDNDLIFVIDSASEIWDINLEKIVLEITEGSILKNQTIAFEQLRKLKERGIKISLDDFGTGYSSLAYFKNIPADELKIDKSFISSLCHNNDDASIVELIINLAKKFNLSVVAEGIEDKETLDQLIDMGCDYAQGYYFSRPIAHKEFIRWINDFNKVI